MLKSCEKQFCTSEGPGLYSQLTNDKIFLKEILIYPNNEHVLCSKIAVFYASIDC